jgi:hypothetical protein
VKPLRRWSLAGWRDTALFLTGLGLIVYEAVIRTGPERPTLLLLYGAMVGLPAFLRADEKRSSKSDESSGQELVG